MQTLLPPKQFKRAVDLQPIKKNEKKPHEKSQSFTTSVEHRPTISKYLILLEEVQNANLNDNICT